MSAPIYHSLERPPRRYLFSDASKTAVGGFFQETGVYWRYELDAGERSRFCGSSKPVADENDVASNVLELVVSASALVSARDERPFATGGCVLKQPLSGCGVVKGESNRDLAPPWCARIVLWLTL